MKKFISALLVVMMLVSMIPATVFAAETATSSMSFASTEQRESLDVNSQVWKNAGIIFTNNKGSGSNVADYSNPIRIYQGSEVVITHEAGLISQIVIESDGTAKYKTALQNSLTGAGYTYTNSGNNYTVNFAPAVESVTFSATAQIRFKTLTVTYEIADEGACTHEGFETYEGTDGVAATCTTTGLTATLYCSNCNEPVKSQQIIPMLPHNIVDGVCEDCGAEAYVLVTDISKLHVGSQILIVATEADYTISTTQGSNNRPQAAVSKAEDKSYVSFGEDAQILTIEAGSEVGTYAFNTGAGYLYAAGGTGSNYLRTKAELDALGSWTIEIDEAGIATIKAADTATTRNWIRYNDSSKIFSCYAKDQKDVAIYILPVAEEPDAPCDHLGYETYEGNDYVAPTCTTTGLTATLYCSNCDAVVKEPEVLPVSHEGFETYTEGYVAPGCETEGATGTTYCSNCDEVVTESEVIPATGHSYVDGTCENCGQADPDYSPDAPAVTGYVLVTDVADITAGGQFVIAVNNGGTYQALGTSISGKINPTTVTVADGVVTTENPPVWEIAAYSNGISLYNGSKYLAYAGSGTNFSSSASPYAWTVEVASEGTFYITSVANSGRGLIYQAGTGNRFGGYATSNRTADGYVGALQLYKLVEEVVDPNACNHELTEVTAGYPATCTADGKEDTLSCKCGQNVQEGAVIPALGHAYDDDCCTRCALINPEAAKQAEAIDGLPQAGDVIIFYHPNDKKAMSTAFIPGGNGGRMGAVSVTKANGMIPYSATHTAVMTVEQVGEYFRFQMNGQYLTADADGGDLMFAALPAEGETDYSLWTVTAAETYGVVITSVHAAYNGTNNQAIEYYQDKFYPYGYKDTYISSYRIQIGLISRIELPPVVEMDGVQYTSFEEAYAYDPDTTIKLLVDFDEINVTGDLYLDLNGHTVGSVTANAVFAGDSSATAEAAGTGKLTTTSPVETTETIGSTKYVALKDEHGVYTFHVLDLKLSAVTLRTNKAGIYYKAELACDEVLAAAIASHGVAVSLVNAPTAAFEADENAAYTQITGAPEGIFTSGSITNIFRAGLSDEKNAIRGEMQIYANAYLKLEDGTVLMGSNGTSKSMYDVMYYLNENFDSLEADVQETAKAFYAQWAGAMVSWKLENLAAAIVPAVSKEEEDQA